MSVEFVFRLVGMVVFALIGWQSIIFFRPENPGESARLIIALTLAGAALGLLITPYITTHPYRTARDKLKEIPASELILGVVGLAIGLGIAALMFPSLSALPNPYGSIMPIAISVVLGYVFAALMVMRQKDIMSTLRPRLPFQGTSSDRVDFGDQPPPEDVVLLDTSVIIDGRIADISQTGFIRSTMLVPRFVLKELQYIADSPDQLRRNRGRRGLDLLRRLQEDSKAPVQVADIDVEGVQDADSKLVMLAKQLNCPVITNDFNLNSVARLQGVIVLNINELANAVKTVILPGETMSARIIQEGKERNQGVAYLSDGTMVVIEDGKHYIDQNVQVAVTKVLQTSAGRMIFAKMENNNSKR